MRAFATAVTLVLTATLPARAVRTEFIALRGNERLSNARVCFFHAGPHEDVFASAFASRDVRCLSADDVIDVPPENWNVYVTHPEGFVSAGPIFQIGGEETPQQAAAYRGVSVNMVRAGTIDFSGPLAALEPGESLAVYLLNEETGLFTAIRPLPKGETTMVVPADTTVVPILVRNRVPRGAGAPLRVRGGETVQANSMLDRATVVVAIRLIASSQVMQELNEIPADAPEIVLVDSRGREVSPLVTGREGARSHRSLMMYGGVQPGAYTLRIRNPNWRMKVQEVVVRDGQSVALSADLDPVTPVMVRWTIPEDLLAALRASCAKEENEQDVTVAILKCAGPDPRDCVALQRQSVPPTPPFSGVLVAGSDDSDGDYHIELGTSETIVRHRLTVRRFAVHQNTINFGAKVISGRVTKGGKPIRAEVRFRTGSGIADVFGRYAAIVGNDPKRAEIRVIPCGADERSAHTFLPDVDVESGTLVDIDIPLDVIRVQVRSATGEALKEAFVQARLLDRNTYEDVLEVSEARTDFSGAAELAHIQPDETFKVCASKPGYRPACVDRARAGSNLSLTLDPRVRWREGKLVSNVPFLRARLYWVSPAGSIQESVSVTSDGRFTNEREHSAEEYCVVVGYKLPLYVLQPTAGELSAMTIHLPTSPVVDVPVTLDTRATVDRGHLGLRIGGRLVPTLAFSAHQQWNDGSPYVTKANPVVIHRVAMTGPVEVLLSPRPLPPGVPDPSQVDLFTLPQYAATFLRTTFIPGVPVVLR